MGFRDEAWVTSALSDEEVFKALILCHSLRRAFTTRKIAVIASPQISAHLRRALDHSFDFVFDIKEERNTAGLNLEDFVKLYSVNVLSAFDLCAYLSPTILIVKNCDDIFTNGTIGMFTMNESKDTSAFLFRPSVEYFETLMAGLMDVDKNGFSLGKYMIKSTPTTGIKKGNFAGKYVSAMSLGGSIISCGQALSMINLANFPEESDMMHFGNSGTIENLVATYWLEMRAFVLELIGKSYDDRPLNVTRNLHNKEAVAIVGMSCRYPGSNNLEEFWQLLLNGGDGTGNPPPFRWRPEHCTKSAPDARTKNAGFLKVPVDEFDANFFGISPKEAISLDPQHRLLHELVWEGLEDACIDPGTLRGTSGSVFMGSYINDYKEILMQSGESQFYRDYMGNSIGAAAARISLLLGMTGPSISTESGCSSAMVAVHLACKSLRQGETNLALACGVNLLLNPFKNDDMYTIFSPDGRCKSFSEDANGFGRAEGGGVLVLKRLSDAIRDHDKIWGVIRGSAVSQEGLSKSLGTPTLHSEHIALCGALRDAKVAAEQVSYIEAHGTGTAVGDPIEIAAIAKAYRTPNRKEPLIIGTVKTNVGHTESCSGITGIMKVILAMHHEMIPAHRNFTKLNPTIDLTAVPAVIPFTRLEWKHTQGKSRIAGVSSFGITGTDAHVILEEPPPTNQSNALTVGSDFERPMHLLKICAKSNEALNILLEKYRVAVRESKEDIADIAFSANSGRADFPIRVAIVAKSKKNVAEIIKQKTYFRGEVNSEHVRKICFLFTGQGSQFHGMAKELYSTNPVFRIHFDHCDKILQENYQISITNVLWFGDSNEINRTIYSQTSIFCVEYALMKLWESWGIKPDYVLGHSLGEFAAAVCAGIITVEDAIQLVAQRSRLIDELPHGKMLVVKADQQCVENALEKFSGGMAEKMLECAAINSNEQTVVAGDTAVVLEFAEYCTAGDMKCTVLEATHAFHSRHMDPMLDKYRSIAKAVKKNMMQKCEYISGLTGDVVAYENIDAEYWVKHARAKVNFLNASRNAVTFGCDVFIEIGPQPVLSSLTATNNQGEFLFVSSLRKREDAWTTLLTSLAKLFTHGLNIDWSGLDRFHTREKVRLPSYPFIGKKLWPNLLQLAGNRIHPLVGCVIPNASAIKIFQSGINLKEHEYIRDHVVGRNVLFPAACYLELCLAAGIAATQGTADTISKPFRQMQVENVVIESPLALEESRPSQIQTVVGFSSSDRRNAGSRTGAANVKIFLKLDAEHSPSWLLQATGTLFPTTSPDEQPASFNDEKFCEIISSPGNSEIPLQLYSKLASVGFKFGPIFKSIETIWNDCTGTTLMQVKIPIEDPHFREYLIHPVMLDAMIQALLFERIINHPNAKLRVPVKIGKFIYMPITSTKAASHMYVQVNNDSALLIDSNSQVRAEMSGVEFVTTTTKVLESVLEQRVKSMPDLWEEIWSASSDSPEHVFNKTELNGVNAGFGRKCWLVFYPPNNTICQYMVDKMAEAGTDRKVVSVVRGTSLAKMADGCYSLGHECEENFTKIINMVSSSTDELEGIIYGWSLDETDKSQENLILPYFLLAKSLLNLKHHTLPRLYLLTSGAVALVDEDIPNFYSQTLLGFTKSLCNEAGGLYCKCIDVGNPLKEADMHSILQELRRSDNSIQVALRGSNRYVPELVPHRPSQNYLTLPAGVDKFKLLLPENRSIGDLKFGPLDPLELDSRQVEIEVKAYALNFRDVLCVLKPTEQFRDMDIVGVDFAGVIKRTGSHVTKWSAGDSVFGFNLQNSTLPSHTKVHEEILLAIPKDLNFCEASTIPIVSATVVYSLIDICNIKSTDTVLIHTASGGVGLAAIQICKYIGATIICTAGRRRKQNYLKSLGVQHVFSSRNISYEKEILKVTNGNGVNIVLNSLTSEGFKEATLNACARGASFVEMSKLSIWKADEVQKLRPDVRYTVVDIAQFSQSEVTKMLTKLGELLNMKLIRSIPYVRFDALNIREALEYMQQAKHIGKIVCTMPEISFVEGGRIETHTPIFNHNATYLITGGLGGIGFEVCKWMLKMGARRVLLAGRSPPDHSRREEIVEMNAEFGANVYAVQLDVSSFEQCQQLLEHKIPEIGFPDLKGIMHTAGALSDSLVQNQTWDTMSSSFKTKVTGTLNLHELTKHNAELEHFVLFSSIAALFGTPGQSNYSAANSFEDAFAQYRNSVGLPATSINWGQWGQVGMAAELDLLGVKPFSTVQGINALEYALKSQHTQIAAIGVESFERLFQLCPSAKDYIKGWQGNVYADDTTVNLDDFWQEFEAAKSQEVKEKIVTRKLVLILKSVLKLDETEISENANFHDWGVDSLMFVEIGNSVQSLIGNRASISTSIIRNSNTLNLLSKRLVNVIEGIDLNDKMPTTDEINELIRSDCILAEDITPKPDAQRVQLENISSVLITGVTGFLGPYVLAELCKIPQVTQITCLIRSSRTCSIAERLENILKERNLLMKVDMQKVVCVAGNVAMPNLGVQEELYRKLCNSVYAVFNCAASVHHTERYKKDSSKNSSRSVNVMGLKHLLQFCCDGSYLKHIYQASSLLAAATVDVDGSITETWPNVDDFFGVTAYAYPITKFIGDVLMKEAITKRCIPGKVFRFALISGESATGQFALENNHFMLRYLFGLKHGIVAERSLPVPVLPVDVCAKISVAIFFNPSVPDDIYNVINSKGQDDREFGLVAERFGHKVRMVSAAEFSDSIGQSVETDSYVKGLKEFYTEAEDFIWFNAKNIAVKTWLENEMKRDNFFSSKKLAKFVPGFYTTGYGSVSSMEYIYKDFLFAKEQGWLQKFGL